MHILKMKTGFCGNILVPVFLRVKVCQKSNQSLSKVCKGVRKKAVRLGEQTRTYPDHRTYPSSHDHRLRLSQYRKLRPSLWDYRYRDPEPVSYSGQVERRSPAGPVAVCPAGNIGRTGAASIKSGGFSRPPLFAHDLTEKDPHSRADAGGCDRRTHDRRRVHAAVLASVGDDIHRDQLQRGDIYHQKRTHLIAGRPRRGSPSGIPAFSPVFFQGF